MKDPGAKETVEVLSGGRAPMTQREVLPPPLREHQITSLIRRGSMRYFAHALQVSSSSSAETALSSPQYSLLYCWSFFFENTTLPHTKNVMQWQTNQKFHDFSAG